MSPTPKPWERDWPADAKPAAKPWEKDWGAAPKSTSGVPELRPTEDTFKRPEGSAGGRAAGGFWDTTIGGLGKAVKVLGHFAQMGATGVPNMEAIQDANDLVQAHIDQARKAKEAWDKGERVEATGHALAAALPVVGPAAAHAGERMGGDAPKLDKYGNVVELGREPDIAGGVGEGVGLIVSSSPKNVAAPVARGVAKAAGKAIPHRLTPEGLYQSSLRPSLSKKNLPKIEKQVKTGLREGVTVDRKGLQKTDATIDALNDEIADRLRGKSDELGPIIDPAEVAARVEQKRPTFAEQVNPEADLASLNRSKGEFLEKHTEKIPYTKIEPSLEGSGYADLGQGVIKQKKPLTLSEAQAEKQGTYRQVNKKFGELGSADIEAQKSLARGLKEEIAKRVPELAELNAREGALIELQNELERMVAREGNKNVLGLVPATMAHNPYGFLATLLMDNPAIKSRIAIALDRVRKIRPSATSVGQSAPAALVGAVPSQEELPHYAKGGIAGKNGPELAVVGEEGPEAIIPLTAERETVPETAGTLKAQLEQLAAGERKVVMFPRGSDLQRKPKGMKSYQDEHGNVFIFDPQQTSQQEIDAAIQNNALPALLGAADGGMGAPDKSALPVDAVAVVGRDSNGTTTQATATDAKHLRKAVRQTKKVTPKGGKVSVEPAMKEIANRLDSPTVGPRSPQWYERHRKRQWFHKG